MRDIFTINVYSDEDHSEYVALPNTKYNVIDALDRARIPDDFSIRICDCDSVPVLNDRIFRSTELDKVMALAQRLDELHEENENYLFAYCAAIMELPKNASINKLLQYTFNLDTLAVLPCGDDKALGNLLLEKDLNPKLKDMDREILELLDRALIGRKYREDNDGVYIGSNCCLRSTYKPVPLDKSQIPQPENWIFIAVLIVGKSFEYAEFPMTDEHLSEFISKHKTNDIFKMKPYEIECAALYLDVCGFRELKAEELNELAKRLSALSRDDFMKFKAACEAKPPDNMNEVEMLLSGLDSRVLDRSVEIRLDYGVRFLEKITPPEFDKSLLSAIESNLFAQKIAERNGVSFTEYGALSAEGMELYAIPESVSEQEETENFDLKM